MSDAQELESISTRLERIAELARRKPGEALLTLAHHLDLELLHLAYSRVRKDGAVGVDGQTAEAYAADLERNLQSLLERAKSGRYHAPPVRRAYIPKGTGNETRPLGIPTFEDKILQRAVLLILEQVYEQDFLDCSYGYRPRRSARQALQVLWDKLMAMRGDCWVLELDIRKFFDTLDHRHLQAILRQRVRDGVLLRLIGKWLNAGVLECGELSYPEAGSPQGGVISPLLANAYLHEVLDLWFTRVILPRLKGKAFLIRYADDAVLVFECEEDALRVLDVLPKRFGKYGLELHPEKTRLIQFKRPSCHARRDPEPPQEPGKFDFLGFTHLWGRSRKGYWVVRQKTALDRFTRGLLHTREWCRKNRHEPIDVQCRTLCNKLRGHDQYFGVRCNFPRIAAFHHEVVRIWFKWLRRRGGKRRLTWDRFNDILQRHPLTKPRLHPYVAKTQS